MPHLQVVHHLAATLWCGSRYLSLSVRCTMWGHISGVGVCLSSATPRPVPSPTARTTAGPSLSPSGRHHQLPGTSPITPVNRSRSRAHRCELCARCKDRAAEPQAAVNLKSSPYLVFARPYSNLRLETAEIIAALDNNSARAVRKIFSPSTYDAKCQCNHRVQ